MADKKDVKVEDLAPKKDAKGGGGRNLNAANADGANLDGSNLNAGNLNSAGKNADGGIRNTDGSVPNLD